MPQSEFWPFGSKLFEDCNNGEASVLQKQLGDMEGEVKVIQMELAAIRKDRLDLHNRQHSDIDEDVVKDTTTTIRDTTKIDEKYQTFTEMSKLREELIRAKNTADEERFKREKYETKLQDLEMKLNGICCTGVVFDAKQESKKHTESEVTNLKSQLRDLKDELEELRLTVTEKTEQLQEYRVKYLQAQQQVEELKRQLDVVDYDSKQVSDHIQLEIQKMKMQFQEKLQELSPLPDLLKGAQIQLQEAKQLQRLAEDSSSQLSNELHRVKEKLITAVNNLNQEKAEKLKLQEENKRIKTSLEDSTKELEELRKSTAENKCQVLRLEEKLSQQETRFKEKSVECAALLKDLDELRIETNRSLSRSKERSDSMRRYLQTQISELERQLVQSRAQCRACQKERDEIRQRMQIQINNLQENFELVEIRLRTLQGQVTSLKTSYTVMLSDDEDSGDFNKITTS
ncbi:interactor of constitutive active ROPs 5-like [Hyposmocoma kahamanoa]|uniref:interactor of constitutive active ROPs 5-like n=1 Tax=Hyposmocoma kahamanoa TaxID=1477025 RepID=UPI000E6D6461|nr:interactor of constitutive active ROPs 5-like [Hyposmocoma kahamanoa]